MADSNDPRETVAAFISHVKDVENIKIKIDVHPVTKVESFKHVNKAPGDDTVGDWLRNRITPRLPADTTVTVYDRLGKPVGSHVLLKFCRPH